MDETAFSVLLSRLRPLMSGKAFELTTSALNQTVARMTGYIGRSDVVIFDPHADYVSFLETAMGDGDLIAVDQEDNRRSLKKK
ncbi:uncharacterized protein LOC117643450 isoform X2 [Thrips palmi]|nr:uncharacterized protein LOC117643450 isoform X2 [Thrips palmi]XP_034238257.1 uncharacterized protein LOC117643450 isoform X2 [Thrips palmi]